MQLRNARLCLDCDEIHEDSHCPICAAESFAFIKRWVTAPERRARQRPQEADGTQRETVATYKELLATNEEPRLTTWQLVRGGAVSLALLGAAGWMWRRNTQQQPRANGSSSNSESASDN